MLKDEVYGATLDEYGTAYDGRSGPVVLGLICTVLLFIGVAVLVL